LANLIGDGSHRGQNQVLRCGEVREWLKRSASKADIP
jgi:hypothetical protein